MRTDIILGGSCHIFCREKSMFVTTTKVRLSRQTYFCRNKHDFVATKHLSLQAYFCCDEYNFVVPKKFLSWQKYACRDKHVFVAINICIDKRFVTTKIFCRDKHDFVATKHLSLQAYFCCDEYNFVVPKHIFVVTKVCLSRQTRVLSRQALFCRDKRRVLSSKIRVCRDRTFVATKMILVAAPANDKPPPPHGSDYEISIVLPFCTQHSALY